MVVKAQLCRRLAFFYEGLYFSVFRRVIEYCNKATVHPPQFRTMDEIRHHLFHAFVLVIRGNDVFAPFDRALLFQLIEKFINCVM